jgi:hypothetical protein
MVYISKSKSIKFGILLFFLFVLLSYYEIYFVPLILVAVLGSFAKVKDKFDNRGEQLFSRYVLIYPISSIIIIQILKNIF